MGNRCVTIQVKNNTKASKLINPGYYPFSGRCMACPLPTVSPGETQQSFFEKTSGTARGAVGVLTYDITTDQDEGDTRLAIMFSVPFDYSYYENWFALGLFNTKHTARKKSLYDLMYAGSASEFTRAKASDGKFKHEHSKYIIEGTMRNDRNSVIEVEFRDKV